MSDESGDILEQAPSDRIRRWRGRNPLIAGVALVVLVAIASVVVVLAIPKSTPSSREFGRLPGPCTLLSAATLAKYLPAGTAGVPQDVSSSATLSQAGCDWTGTANHRESELWVYVTIYPSGYPAGNAKARAVYAAGIRSDRSVSVTGFSIRVQSLAHVGDDAAYLFTTVGHGAYAPQFADLLVSSENADIQVGYSSSLIQSNGLLLTTPGSVSEEIAITRAVIASLPRG
jgi:hypothetical protein